VDACDPATGAVTHTPVAVDDGNACTVDACDPATGVVTHASVAVDDGNACTADACDPATGAVTHAPAAVDDGVACTVDSCDPATGPVHAPSDARCGPGEYCDAGRGCLPVPIVEACEMNLPPTMTAAPYAQTEAAIGWIYVPGVTDAAGPGAGVVAEVGFGAQGTDPAAGWTWFATTFYGDRRTFYDAYAGAMIAPAAPGTYDYLYRVTLDGGNGFTYCDVLGILDPAAPAPGILTVVP
jgi:hypothetical protein